MLDKNITIEREGLRDKYSLLFIQKYLLYVKHLQHFLVFGDISVGKKIDKASTVIKLIL